MAGDPFELDQRALDAKLKALQGSLDRWRQVRAGAAELATEDELAEAEDEFNWLTDEIHKSTKSIGWDLDDLGETLRRMSEQPGRRQDAQGSSPRAEYIRAARELVSAVEAEVRAGRTKLASTADASDAPEPEPRPAAAAAAPEMTASTERLVQSLLQQDEDDDVELLIRDDPETGRRRQFAVTQGGPDARESPAQRLWRRHRPALLFVGLVLLLLLLVLVISVGTARRAGIPATTTAPK